MTPPALAGGILVVLLINVLGGMIPGTMDGDLQLAYWIFSLLMGLLVYVILLRATE